jgi:ribokinase
MARATNTATVGHVEWIDFLRVPRLPVAGEVLAAEEHWAEAGGGGAVAAATLAGLNGGSLFLTALGRDELAARSVERLRGLGVEVHAASRPEPTRRAITFVDAHGERTITTVGARLQPAARDRLPWERLGAIDALYFTAGDENALRAARRARVLVATPRAGDALRAGVELDALVLSGNDAVERRLADLYAPVARLVVVTEGAAGGSYCYRDGTSGRWDATPPAGPIVDTYGCGDSFAAGLTCALGAGRTLEDALAFAARCGAARLTGHGPYAGELPAL